MSAYRRIWIHIWERGDEMGWLNSIWSSIIKKKPKTEFSNLNAVDIIAPSFSGSYDPEMNATYTSICETHARFISKAILDVRLKSKEAPSKKDLKSLLQLRANPNTPASSFLNALAYDYFMFNNAFAYIERDYTDYRLTNGIKALWVIKPDDNMMTLSTNPATGKQYIRFYLDGDEKIVDTKDLIILRRQMDPRNFFGKRNLSVDTVLKVLQTNYEGVDQAIKTSAYIRFLIQSTTMLTPEKKLEKANEFAEQFLGETATGIAYVDGAEKITPVQSQAKYANYAEVKVFRDEIFGYLNSNEKILKAMYTEDEYQAYYETALEPFSIQLAQEMTYKLLSPGEVAAGNQIVIENNRLQTASLSTRVKIAALMLKQPVIKPNDINELLYMKPTENGDKEYQTLNYTDIDKEPIPSPDKKPDDDPNNNEEDNQDG